MFFFFFNDTATTEIYTLSLHDALPISVQQVQRLLQQPAAVPGEEQQREREQDREGHAERREQRRRGWQEHGTQHDRREKAEQHPEGVQHLGRSEEHTSELQSPCNLVCRLLLE